MITPLMLRVHCNVPQASELCFLDASGNMDWYEIFLGYQFFFLDNVSQIGDRLQSLEERVAGTDESSPFDFHNSMPQNSMLNSIVTKTLPIDSQVKKKS